MYYCGITNDISRREAEHHAEFIKHLRLPNRVFADEVERFMGRSGFDVGRRPANGGNKRSVYVYIYRKIKGKTIETP